MQFTFILLFFINFIIEYTKESNGKWNDDFHRNRMYRKD